MISLLWKKKCGPVKRDWAGVQTRATGTSYVTLDRPWHLSTGLRFYFSQVNGTIPDSSASRCAWGSNRKREEKCPNIEAQHYREGQGSCVLASWPPAARRADHRRALTPRTPTFFPSYPISQIWLSCQSPDLGLDSGERNFVNVLKTIEF